MAASGRYRSRFCIERQLTQHSVSDGFMESTAFDLRHRREAREWIAIERFGLPCGLVPRSVLIADDLHRQDDAIAAQLVGGGDAVIKFSIGANFKLNRPR